MKVEDVYSCDLCGKTIQNYNPNGARMIEFFSGVNQVWPVGEKKYDVCAACCIVLDRASSFGLISKIDLDPLYEQARYEKIGEYFWRAP